MDSIHCEAFLAAADTGSFTAAAERLGYTQSGITRMIGSLEEELGFPLFLRSKRGVVLTDNGKDMIPLLRAVAKAERDVEERSAEIRGMVCGTLHIGSYFSISAMWLPQILSRFLAAYPGIRVSVQEGSNAELLHWFRERAVDCCFCASENPEGPSGIDWIPLYRDELVMWLPESHPLARASFYPVQNLNAECFIHTHPGEDTDQDRLLARWHLHPDARFTTKDGFVTYQMVAAVLGVSFHQRLISKKWHGRVFEVPFDPPQYISLGIAVPSLKEASPAARRFIAFAREDQVLKKA